MQLSLHADYGLRVLIYLGSHPGEVVPTQRISEAYGISKHHLVRVAQTLGQRGYVRVIPGRSGGVTLVRPPASIRLGDVVRDVEPNLNLVECFDRETNTCPIIDACGLRRHLAHALDAFVDDLNRHTLAELVTRTRRQRIADVFVEVTRRRPDRP